jgi:hypothetical protein
MSGSANNRGCLKGSLSMGPECLSSTAINWGLVLIVGDVKFTSKLANIRHKIDHSFFSGGLRID